MMFDPCVHGKADPVPADIGGIKGSEHLNYGLVTYYVLFFIRLETRYGIIGDRTRF